MQIEVFTNMGDLHIHYTRELINSLVIFYFQELKMNLSKLRNGALVHMAGLELGSSVILLNN